MKEFFFMSSILTAGSFVYFALAVQQTYGNKNYFTLAVIALIAGFMIKKYGG